jgi:predicted DNA binding CopG/RHH family protein
MAPLKQKGQIMTRESREPQVNDTKQKNEKTIVSIRGVSKELWKKVKVKTTIEGITVTQYITDLIEKDFSNKR